MMAYRRNFLRKVVAVLERAHKPYSGISGDAATYATSAHSKNFSSSASALSRWSSSFPTVSRAAAQISPVKARSLTDGMSFSSAATTPQVDGKDGNNPETSTEGAPAATQTEDEPVQTEGGAERKGGDEEVKKDDMIVLLAEKLAEIEDKENEIKELKERVMWYLAEMENLRERTRRDADSTRKYAIQNFAKGLLDVADNLSRAAGAVPEDVAKSNAGDDPSGNLKLLQSLLQGVEMTEKQLHQAFKKHGLEKYDPLGEAFDPSKHAAVFDLEDKTKEPGTVALVLKAGYLLNDRVIRPAEVAVVKDSSTE